MNPGDTATSLDTRDSGIHSNAHGASLIQVETLGKSALIILIILLMIALVTAIGAVVWSGTAASSAAVAADRADRAERRSNISEAYAKQVYVELNRLGYPVQTPIEEHSVAPAEAYKRDP